MARSNTARSNTARSNTARNNMARREPAPKETPRETALIALGLLAFCTGLLVVMRALLLGFYIEGTPNALADATKGQQIAIPAVVALLAGVVALAGRRRGWAFPVAWLGVAAAAVAVLLTILLPGGEY
jgi:hypothetical protein